MPRTFPEYDIKLAASFVVDGVKDADDDLFRVLAARDLILVLVGLDPLNSYKSRPALVGAIRKALEERKVQAA